MVPSPALPDTSALTEYKSSAALSRYFCPTCGASVVNIEPHEWEFASGLFTVETRKEVCLNRVQLWVFDTHDGGCTAWLQAASGRGSMKAKSRDSEEVSLEQVEEMRELALQSVASTGKDSGEKLEAGCKCGKVRFYITKPKETPDKGRYKAFFCPCTSCRLTTGFEITAWVTIPHSNLFSLDEKALDLSAANEGLERYESSPAVDRFFCQGCGATAFYWDHRLKGSTRSEEVDVAAGLLRYNGGALAENWLEWKKNVKYVEDAIDPEFVEGFVKALAEVHPLT